MIAQRGVSMNRVAGILSAFLFASLATGAEAQTKQFVCSVKWEKDCIDALLNRRTCPQALSPAAQKGTLTIEGERAKTRDLGPVVDYAMVKKATGVFALEGEWSAPGQHMRGHGTFDLSTGKLTLFLSLGKHPGDDNILQRGLMADCR
jgi:hypothetical protein